MPTFPEAGGEHDGGANSVGVGLFQNAAGGVGPDRDDDEVDG